MNKKILFILFIALAILCAIVGVVYYIFSDSIAVLRSEKPQTVSSSQAVGSDQNGEGPGRQINNPVVEALTVPSGFVVEVFADDLGGDAVAIPGPNSGPRLLMERKGAIYASLMKQGKIEVFHDQDRNAYVEKKTTFLQGLNNPHGIEQYKDWVYIAEEDRVIRVKDADGNHQPELETLEELVQLPSGLGHYTRTIKIIDNKLFISTGSSCNTCDESESFRATIQQCDLDGKKCELFAEGLRNSVDFIEYQGKIFATENSRDNIGNDIPPDEINVLEKGKHYGWPACYGRQITDVTFESDLDCEEDTEPSFVDLPAHVAPLGIGAYTGNAFPEKYQNKLFVAYHGSWNRNPPSGYEVVMINPENGRVESFISGFLDGEVVRGRPVGILQYLDSLLISDDNAGRIYRVVYVN